MLSSAFQNGDPADARVAVALYAFVGRGSCACPWLVLFHYLRGQPRLLEPDVEPTFFSRECIRAWVGIFAYTLAGVAGWAVNPLIATLIFLALPIFYGITSEGLPEGRRFR